MNYNQTLSRVETYFDKTALKTWERLTSKAPVSRVRESVRRGRDDMRMKLISQLPSDLSGAKVLDAGCGTGQLSEELALRGCQVFAADISPSLVNVARSRIPNHLHKNIEFITGDMVNPNLGNFDYVIAMDSLIYYSKKDLMSLLVELSSRTSHSIFFTLAPKTMLLMMMWYLGKIAPKGDRSPVMVPQSLKAISKELDANLQLIDLGVINSGFYISHAIGCRK
jgi:magnesium-protoporphyrin O-methyltransferase